MRLFIAIDLPDFIKDYLRTVQEKLPDAKMSKTRDFHLTLKFFGSCDFSKRKKIEEALRAITFNKFEAKLENIGTFDGSRPRVIWVGIRVPLGLSDTVSAIEKAMRKLGFPPTLKLRRAGPKENRFTPHITLARVKYIADPKQFAAQIEKIRIEPLIFPVAHYYLFESKLSPKGSEHIKLSQFP